MKSLNLSSLTDFWHGQSRTVLSMSLQYAIIVADLDVMDLASDGT